MEETEKGLKRGADIFVESLVEQGVDTIFGYPGGAVLPIYDALYRSNAPFDHVLCRHEQGLIHAAEGYARVTGKPGVVIATSGPGATNLITGITDAMMDSLPMVIFTGQVATRVIGTDAFQEADVIGLTTPITKYNYQVTSLKELPRVIKEAFHIATTGRKGPVVIDIPKNVSRRICFRNVRYNGPFAGVPADDETESAANPPAAGSVKHSRAARSPRRSRRAVCGSKRRAPEVCQKISAARRDDTARPRQFSRIGSPVFRDGRNARNVHCQHGDL